MSLATSSLRANNPRSMSTTHRHYTATNAGAIQLPARRHQRRSPLALRPTAVARPQRSVAAANPNLDLTSTSTAPALFSTTTSKLQSPPNNRKISGPITLGATLLGAGLLGTGFDVSGPSSVLEALAVLAAVVGIHEAGHFTAARLQNIHVTKFAIGFGPPLLSFTRNDVEYSFRAFPLGGFVSFPDDDPESPYPIDDPDLYRNRPVLDRMIVTSAGVIANVIFAYSICLTQALTVGVSAPIFEPGVKLGTIYPGAVAETSGLQRGDIVLSVGDLKIAPTPRAVEEVVDKIARNPGVKLHVELQRDGKPLELDVIPAEMPDGTGRIGVGLGANVTANRIKADGLVQATQLAAKEFNSLANTVIKGLGQFFTNFQQTASNVSGPVAILAVGSEVARTDATGLYRFAALININLAVVNILPLPALDGGYLALQLLEVIRGGRRIDADLEKGIMASGFLLLTSVGLLLIVRDALNLATKL